MEYVCPIICQAILKDKNEKVSRHEVRAEAVIKAVGKTN